MKKTLLPAMALMLLAGGLSAAPVLKGRSGNAARPGQAFREKAMKDPAVKAAQEKVWDARLALYAAKHDRALAGVVFAKAEVEKNNPADKAEKLKALDEAKVNIDKAYELSKQMVAAERAGDQAKIQSIRQQMRDLRMHGRGNWGSARDRKTGGANAPARGRYSPEEGVGPMGPMWGDEGMD